MDVAEILHKAPIFSGLDVQSLRSLTPLFEEESFSAKEKILREGEFGDSMYIIIDGQVTVTKSSDGGKEILITKLGEASYFGEVALIDNQPRSANVNAEKNTTVFNVGATPFNGVERSEPAAIGFTSSHEIGFGIL